MPLPMVPSPPPTFSCFKCEDEADLLVVTLLIERLKNSDADMYERFRRQLRSVRKVYKHPRFILDFSAAQEFTVDAFMLVICMNKKMKDASRSLVLCGLNDDLRQKLSIAGHLNNFSVCDTADKARSIIRC